MNAPQDAGSVLKPASLHTCQANATQSARLDFNDDSCFDEAQRGFVASIPDARITTPDGRVVWDLSVFAFLENIEAPDSVNPSLWRHARINRIHGLFRVSERIYQVRGFDLANITIIEGDTGLILIDPLTYCEAAIAALACTRIKAMQQPNLRAVFNLTGTVLHTNLGRATLPDAAIAAGEAAAAMQATLDANPQGKHGKHSYSLEEFGLSADQIKERFAGYIAEYGL